MYRIEKTVEFNASIEACYKALLQFERYPDFLPFIQSVQRRGGNNVWQWKIRTLDGTLLVWDMEMLGGKHQHHSISWHTIRDADIAHSGAITLQATDDNKTQAHLVVEYRSYTISPVEQRIDQALSKCLRALQDFIEHGAVSSKFQSETLNKM